MKLGVAGLLGNGSPEAARKVRDLGFNAASWHLPDLALAGDEEALLRVRDALEHEEIELCQLLPPDYPSLVHPSPEVRAAGIEALKTVIQAATVLEAGNVYIRPGSLNGRGPWTPHPENRLPETLDRLVESLRSLVPAAEDAGIPLAIEAHVVSPLYSVGVVAEVLERVGSPLLGFNADPVNLVGTLDQAYDTSSLIQELFDRLGHAVLTAHAKDVTVEDRLVMHIQECVPGQGYLDQESFLRRCEEAAPRGVVLIEHLAEDRVPEARRAILDFASRAGVIFEMD